MIDHCPVCGKSLCIDLNGLITCDRECKPRHFIWCQKFVLMRCLGCNKNSEYIKYAFYTGKTIISLPGTKIEFYTPPTSFSDLFITLMSAKESMVFI
jgi:hypothetical protein